MREMRIQLGNDWPICRLNDSSIDWVKYWIANTITNWVRLWPRRGRSSILETDVECILFDDSRDYPIVGLIMNIVNHKR